MIPGYVRERTSADQWAKDRVAPHSFRVVIVDEFRCADTMWRRLAGVRPCIYTVGPGHRRCHKPARVGILRGSASIRQLWPYCDEHLYGRRRDGDRMLAAIVVPEDEEP